MQRGERRDGQVIGAELTFLIVAVEKHKPLCSRGVADRSCGSRLFDGALVEKLSARETV